MKRFVRKLDRMLTAMSYAEAGDLDAVKTILDQDEAQWSAAAVMAPKPPEPRMEEAKILEFKRAKPAGMAEPVF